MYAHTYIGVLLCIYLHKNLHISTNIAPFHVVFRAVDQANLGLQGKLVVQRTTSRYEEPTVGKVYVA